MGLKSKVLTYGGDDGERRGREILSGSFTSQSRADPTTETSFINP